ncbi:methyltransferase domain-containing protein [Streptomyces sp. NPDC051576]|uniref:class I SAM-dependent methyltransferase n=1 Tax=Streptomyces sp. NPDC051576 TaxID=3155803 RepID=UPI00341E60FD
MGSVSESDEMHRLFDKTAKVYDQSGVEFFGPIGRRLVEFANLSAGASVLDVGCGRGAALLPAAAAVGPDGEAVGIDISEEMTRYATEAVREHGLGHVSVSVMDGRAPAFPVGRFDAVVGSCSLFIWTKNADHLRPYRELLRPGGTFATAAPSFFSTLQGKWALFPDIVNDLLMPYMLRSLKQSGSYDSQFAEAGTNWLATPELIEQTLTEAGFVGAVVREEDLPVVVESGEQWVEFTYTTGMRGMWERIEDEKERTELVAEVCRRLDGIKDGSGAITTHVPIVYMRAQTPGVD